jgi:hypothetical protein
MRLAGAGKRAADVARPRDGGAGGVYAMKGLLGFDVGLYWTPGAPAGSAPPVQQRLVIAHRVKTWSEAMDELSEIARTAQALQLSLNQQAIKNTLTYVPLPALGWFIEPVYMSLQSIELKLREVA